MQLLKMVKRKLKRVGFRGSMIDLIHKIGSLADFRARRIAKEGQAFDKTYKIETTGYVPVSSFDVPDEDFLKAGSYRPTPVPLFRELIEKLKIDYSRFNFIDFGSGKGRTLLLASEFNFKKIIGIEFSKKLHEIAVANIAAYKEKEKIKGQSIESIFSNAIKYEIPQEPCIFYFFNPFQYDIMSEVVENIIKSLKIKSRDAYIIYLKPLYPKSIESKKGFERIATLEWNDYEYPCFIYKWVDSI